MMHWLGKIVRKLRPEFRTLSDDSVSIMYEFLNFGRPSKNLLIQSYNGDDEKTYEAQPECFFKPAAEVTKDELVLYPSGNSR